MSKYFLGLPPISPRPPQVDTELSDGVDGHRGRKWCNNWVYLNESKHSYSLMKSRVRLFTQSSLSWTVRALYCVCCLLKSVLELHGPTYTHKHAHTHRIVAALICLQLSSKYYLSLPLSFILTSRCVLMNHSVQLEDRFLIRVLLFIFIDSYSAAFPSHMVTNIHKTELPRLQDSTKFRDLRWCNSGPKSFEIDLVLSRAGDSLFIA